MLCCAVAALAFVKVEVLLLLLSLRPVTIIPAVFGRATSASGRAGNGFQKTPESQPAMAALESDR